MEDVSGAPLPRRGERGFSLVEVLIASALLFMVMIGLVPLFLQSVLNNASGNQSSIVSNAARSAAEQLFAFDYNNQALVVTEGAQNQKEVTQYFDDTTQQWVNAPTVVSGQQMERTVTLRQFQLRDLEEDGILDEPFLTPLATGGAVNVFPVHLREIEVEVAGRAVDGGALGRVLNKTVTVRVLRGF